MAGPDTKNTDAPYPIWGFGPPSPEPDTKKLDALLDSMNGSAERFQTLWFSFLGLTLYLAIAALATTHRDLLLNNPQTLPILNIKVELLPFYIIAPLLYLVFHFYLLMMLALLARTAAEFDKQLRSTLPGKPEQERYRARVENALFLQLLVGMKGERTGINALLMGLIALITIVLAPLATLVLMQMMFLPYHHLRITWWHRAVVVADLLLIVVMTYRCFFPRGVRKAPLVLGALSRKPRWAAAIAFCVLLAVVLMPAVRWLSFQQGRWAGEPRPSSFAEWGQWMEGKSPRPSSVAEWGRWMEGKHPPDAEMNPDYGATAHGVVFGLFPDRLNLEGETIVGEEQLEKTRKEIASRGGDFVPTVNLDKRDLQAADLSEADLRGVSLDDATMRGADLTLARLDGASLRAANLQGARLDRAPGANFSFAMLQGALLVSPLLQGASLFSAQLQGANLDDAQLQGTDLSQAQLQGANLHGAQLQGAFLFQTQFEGTDLGGADLSDSALLETFVFRADISDANLSMAAIRSTHADKVKYGDSNQTAPLTDADVDGWIAAATAVALQEDRGITQRFARLRPDFEANERDSSDRAKWTELDIESLDPDGRQYRARLADRLGDLACDRRGAPYIARGLVSSNSGPNVLLSLLGDLLEGVRTRMKAGREKPEACPGVAGFTDADWQRLESIKPAEAAHANP